MQNCATTSSKYGPKFRVTQILEIVLKLAATEVRKAKNLYMCVSTTDLHESRLVNEWAFEEVSNERNHHLN
jgi:hypothetical protein